MKYQRSRDGPGRAGREGAKNSRRVWTPHPSFLRLWVQYFCSLSIKLSNVLVLRTVEAHSQKVYHLVGIITWKSGEKAPSIGGQIRVWRWTSSGGRKIKELNLMREDFLCVMQKLKEEIRALTIRFFKLLEECNLIILGFIPLNHPRFVLCYHWL